MSSDLPNTVIEFYRIHVGEFDRDRTTSLMERPYLDAMIERLGERGHVLDLGCGSGEPIAKYFIERGHSVTGVDTSPAMLALARERFPDQSWVEGDMRYVDVPSSFDAVIAWDSFFHLTQSDQRTMFPRFANWLRPGGVLLFTSGPEAGEAIGEMYGEPLYHASLSPDEYRSAFHQNELAVVQFTPEDPQCGGHTVWIAQKVLTSAPLPASG